MERFRAPPDEPKEFAAYMRSEMEKWGKVIQTAGVRGE